jgi:formylglycine-generating enzyme required for sulfatase activity
MPRKKKRSTVRVPVQIIGLPPMKKGSTVRVPIPRKVEPPPLKNPLLQKSSPDRVYRGGGWGGYASNVRAPFRLRDQTSVRVSFLSFRLFRTLEKS